MKQEKDGAIDSTDHTPETKDDVDDEASAEEEDQLAFEYRMANSCLRNERDLLRLRAMALDRETSRSAASSKPPINIARLKASALKVLREKKADDDRLREMPTASDKPS